MPELNAPISSVFASTDINVSPGAVLKHLGYEKTDTTGSYIHEIIEKCILEAGNLYSPHAYIVFKELNAINTLQGSIVSGNIEFNVMPIIASQLQNAESLAFFACTIGKQLERHVDTLFQQCNMLEGYIFSIIGSEAAEWLAGAVHRHIGELSAKEGLRITNRFSPGYCKWDVAEQHKLFSLFPAGFCNIELTESALMDPVKSVSGLIGVGADVENKQYQCRACKEEKCLYRDKK